MNGQIDLRQFPSPAVLADEAARHFVAVAQAALSERGTFSVALSGGSTPRAMYERLALSPLRDEIDWSGVHLFFSDERFVPPDSPDSNYHTARTNLIDHVSIPPGNVHPYSTVDIEPAQSAEQYEASVRALVGTGQGDMPAFDLILLGMGPDGHTASLFPDTAALSIRDRLIAPNYVPKLETWRLTFTYPLIDAGRVVTFLVQGSDKSARVREILAGGSSLPAAHVQPSPGRLVWLLDSAAAAELDVDGSKNLDGTSNRSS